MTGHLQNVYHFNRFASLHQSEAFAGVVSLIAGIFLF
jgi:hypothetical protein